MDFVRPVFKITKLNTFKKVVVSIIR